jgi:tRNA (cytidine/uridine-2'-O-)-methyltransferase
MKAQFNKNLKIMPKIVLYQPDIAGNVGTIIRSCVAFNCDLHIIEPCGFVFNLNKIKKSALDYLNYAKIYRHDSFEIFFNQEILKNNHRLVLASTKASSNYCDFNFKKDDFLMFGRESSGVPVEIFNQIDHRIFIPTSQNVRSLNIACACSIIIAKACEKISLS